MATEHWKFERTLDARGLQCPLPVLKARKTLLAMAPGARLMLIATDPLASIDVPHFSAESGNRLVDTAVAEGETRFLIEKA
jgi:tRNA 2-thiouridine synthesizing protein A